MKEVSINVSFTEHLLHCPYIPPLATKQRKCHTGWPLGGMKQTQSFPGLWGREQETGSMQTSKCKSEKGGRGQRCHAKGRSKGRQDKATWSVGDGEAGRRKANPGGPVTESPARTSLLSPTPLKYLQLNPRTEQQLAWLLPFLPMPH